MAKTLARYLITVECDAKTWARANNRQLSEACDHITDATDDAESFLRERLATVVPWATVRVRPE